MKKRHADPALPAALSAIILFGCSQESAGPAREELLQYAEQFVPADASKKIISPDVPWVQVSFEVRRAPLEFAIDEERLVQEKANGWMLCRPTTSEWMGTAYGDATVERYRQTRIFVLYKDGVYIQLTGEYDSSSEATSVRKIDGQTEKPIQHFYVIARRTTDAETRQMAMYLGLACDASAESDG